MSYLLSFFLFSALLHRIATAEELEALNAPYVRKYIRVSTIERLGFFFKKLFKLQIFVMQHIWN